MRSTILLLFATALAWGQPAPQAAKPPVPFSRHFIETKQYSQAENEAIVAKYKGLRTTDVFDALQAVGLHKVTVMDHGIKPMWVDGVKLSHTVYGVAITLRLVPPQETPPNTEFKSNDEMMQWQRTWSKRYMQGGYTAFIAPETVLVIEAPLRADNGFCGSNNALSWKNRGLRGIVTEAGCRDTDEMWIQRIPVYQRESTRFINEGTIAVESYNTPVVVGGVLVMPGDVIVADMNGVAVVPRAKAELVAKIAREIHDSDNKTRMRLYKEGGLEPDFTLTR